MARGKRMFKQTTLCHIENASDTGAWNSFADLKKQQDAFTSAYIDYVKISYIQEEQVGSPVGDQDLLLAPLFAAATSSTLSSTPSSNVNHIIAAAGGTLGGGTVYLPIKRRIVLNELDEESGEAMIRLFVKNMDLSTGYSDAKWHIVMETYGRWHKTEAL